MKKAKKAKSCVDGFLALVVLTAIIIAFIVAAAPDPAHINSNPANKSTETQVVSRDLILPPTNLIGDTTVGLTIVVEQFE